MRWLTPWRINRCSSKAEILDSIDQLSRLGGTPAVRTLLRFLNHEDCDVENRAKEAVLRIGDRVAMPALLEGLNATDEKTLNRLSSVVWEIRERNALPPTVQSQIERILLIELADSKPPKRARAIHLARWFFEKPPLQLLEKVNRTSLGDPSPEVRAEAALALGDWRTAVETVIGALRDPEASVRGMAALALGWYGEKRDLDRAVPHLLTMFDDPSSEVRCRAVQAFYHVADLDSRVAFAGLSVAVTNSDRNVRKQAISSLGTLEHTDALGPVGLLIRASSDLDSEVRELAVEVLCRRLGNASELLKLPLEMTEGARDLLRRLSADKPVRNEGAAVLMKLNLKLWRDSQAPLLWVRNHQGEWSHTDWQRLIEQLRNSSYWPMEEREVGSVLEGLKPKYRKEQEAKCRADEYRRRGRGKQFVTRPNVTGRLPHLPREYSYAFVYWEPKRARECFDLITLGIENGIAFPFEEKPYQIALVSDSHGEGIVAISVQIHTWEEESVQVFEILNAWFEDCGAPKRNDWETLIVPRMGAVKGLRKTLEERSGKYSFLEIVDRG